MPNNYSSTEQGKSHPDFAAAWIQKILSDPDIETIPELPPDSPSGLVSSSLYDDTLSHDTGLRARVFFSRPCNEPDAVSKQEYCQLVSVGHGVDGKPGRAHGGFSSLLLDNLTGSTPCCETKADVLPATATMSVDYKAPIGTPCVVLGRAWVIATSGRKFWVKGVLENERGEPYAIAKALHVYPRGTSVKL